VLLPELVFWNAQEAIATVQKYVESKESGSAPTLFGYTVTDSGEWVLTRASKTHRLVLEGLNHLARNVFKLIQVIRVRVGKGCATLCSVPHAQSSTVIYWFDDVTNLQFVDLDTTSANLRV